MLAIRIMDNEGQVTTYHTFDRVGMRKLTKGKTIFFTDCNGNDIEIYIDAIKCFEIR